MNARNAACTQQHGYLFVTLAQSSALTMTSSARPVLPSCSATTPKKFILAVSDFIAVDHPLYFSEDRTNVWLHHSQTRARIVTTPDITLYIENGLLMCTMNSPSFVHTQGIEIDAKQDNDILSNDFPLQTSAFSLTLFSQ